MSSLQTLRLHIEISLWRYGWIWLVTPFALLCAASLHFWWLPQQVQTAALLSQRLSSLEFEHKRRRQAPAPVQAISEDVQAVGQLKRVSYSPTEVSTALQLVQQIARAKGISLVQSEFQTTAEGFAGLKQVQVTLPLRCSYPQLRDFTNTVLRQLPGVSLDQIILKRDNIAQSHAEVRLKISIWVDPNKPTQVPTSKSAKSLTGFSPKVTP